MTTPAPDLSPAALAELLAEFEINGQVTLAALIRELMRVRKTLEASDNYAVFVRIQADRDRLEALYNATLTERDAARAEVERLRVEVPQAYRDELAALRQLHSETAGAFKSDNAKLTVENAELRALLGECRVFLPHRTWDDKLIRLHERIDAKLQATVATTPLASPSPPE